MISRGEFGEPAIRFAAPREAVHIQMIIGLRFEKTGISLHRLGMSGPGPGQHGPFGFEGMEVAEGLAVAVPEFLAGDSAPEGAQADLPHRPPARRVQPDHGGRILQDQILDLVVVAIDDPGFMLGEKRFDVGTERLIGKWGPVRLMKHAIQFQSGKAEDLGGPPGKGGLSRTTATDDGDSPVQPAAKATLCRRRSEARALEW